MGPPSLLTTAIGFIVLFIRFIPRRDRASSADVTVLEPWVVERVCRIDRIAGVGRMVVAASRTHRRSGVAAPASRFCWRHGRGTLIAATSLVGLRSSRKRWIGAHWGTSTRRHGSSSDRGRVARRKHVPAASAVPLGSVALATARRASFRRRVRCDDRVRFHPVR